MSAARNNTNNTARRSTTPRGPKVSLSDDYDGRRVVNTPLSLHACQLEGVDPYSLTIQGREHVSKTDEEDINEPNSSATRNKNKQLLSSSSKSLQNLGSTKKGQADTIFDVAVPLSKEQQAVKEKFLEHRRQLLFSSVLRTYKKLTSPRSTLPPPPLALTGELPEDMEEDRRKKFSNKPKSVTSTLRRLAQQDQQNNDEELGASTKSASLLSTKNATVLSSDNSQEVARYYSKLESLTQKQWKANLECEQRDKQAKEHWANQTRASSEAMSARGRQRDEHMSLVKTHHDEKHAERLREIEQRMKREQEKMDSVLNRKRQRQEEAMERGMTRGDQQRSTANRVEESRLATIAEKNMEKQERQDEASQRREREKQMHDFEGQLNSLMSRDTQLRAARAAEYRKEVFNERIAVADYTARKRKEDMNDKFHDAMVQRDAVHRLKEQLDGFFGQLPKRPAEATARYSTKGEIGGDFKIVPPNEQRRRENSARNNFNKQRSFLSNFDGNNNNNNNISESGKEKLLLPKIEPPTWLSKEVGLLHETQQQKRAESKQRSIIIRDNNNAANDNKNNDKDSATNSPRSSSVKRAQHARRWPYTAPESEKKVAYPKWMYQSD